MMQAGAAAVMQQHSNSMYSAQTRMLVTMRVDGQLFGISVEHVQDVLRTQKVARIPLSPDEVAGAINLRGRIVTVIDVRRRLKVPPTESTALPMFVVVEHQGELYSLMVDGVGEVMNVPVSQIESSPSNLQGGWGQVADGVCRLPEELLVILDIKTLLER